MATSKGRIHDVFRDRLADLTTTCQAQAEAVRAGSDRPWYTPEGITSTLDVPGIQTAFERDEIGLNYGRVIGDAADPGTVGDAVSLTIQSDRVACLERAYRARHASVVRCLALAAARRGGHGKPSGPLLGGALQCAQDALNAGMAEDGSNGGAT